MWACVCMFLCICMHIWICIGVPVCMYLCVCDLCATQWKLQRKDILFSRTKWGKWGGKLCSYGFPFSELLATSRKKSLPTGITWACNTEFIFINGSDATEILVIFLPSWQHGNLYSAQRNQRACYANTGHWFDKSPGNRINVCILCKDVIYFNILKR